MYGEEVESSRQKDENWREFSPVSSSDEVPFHDISLFYRGTPMTDEIEVEFTWNGSLRRIHLSCAFEEEKPSADTPISTAMIYPAFERAAPPELIRFMCMTEFSEESGTSVLEIDCSLLEESIGKEKGFNQ